MYFFFAYFCFVSATPCFPSKATVNSTWLWTLFLRRSVLWLFRICYINQQVLSFMALVSAQYSLCSVPSSSCILWNPLKTTFFQVCSYLLLFSWPTSGSTYGTCCSTVLCLHKLACVYLCFLLLALFPLLCPAPVSCFCPVLATRLYFCLIVHVPGVQTLRLSSTLFRISPSASPLISAASSCQLVAIIGTMTWRPSPLDSPSSLA